VDDDVDAVHVREDTVDGDVAHQGLGELLIRELLKIKL
jgi:hypothetical protein